MRLPHILLAATALVATPLIAIVLTIAFWAIILFF